MNGHNTKFVIYDVINNHPIEENYVVLQITKKIFINLLGYFNSSSGNSHFMLLKSFRQLSKRTNDRAKR